MNHHTLPNGWRRVSLEDVAHIQTGLAIGRTVNDNPVKLPYLRVANVQDGYLNLTEIKEVIVSKNDAERFRLHDGDVLMTEGGDFDKLGRGCVWESPIPHCLHQNHVFAVRTVREKLLPQFFAYHAAGPIGRLYLLSCSKQSTNLASINSTQLKQMPVPVPPLREQAAIASLLATWDQAIGQTTALIQSKERLKRGLMQEPVRGVRRFKKSKADWQTYHIGDLLKEVNRHVILEPNNSYRLVSVRRNSGGLFDREIRLGRDIGYAKLMFIETGDFLIARRQVIHGAMTVVNEAFNGAFVSDAYATLVPKDHRRLHMPFLNVLSQTPEMYYSAFRCSYGVAIEKMVFHLDWFLKEQITIPVSIEEQKRITELFAALDDEIRQLNSKLNLLKQQKRGLMQQLLTGKIRVSDSLINLGAKS